jgi:chromosome partitioning protein
MTAKIITVAQQKGGAGKTTLVANLGIAFASVGKRVALIDVDPQGSLSAWSAVRSEASPPARVSVAVSDIAGWRVDTEVSKLSRDYDLMIIDSPPHAETEAKAAIRAANLVIIPVQPSPMDVWATDATVTLAGDSRTSILVVLNRMPARGNVATWMREKLAEKDLPVAKGAIGNRVGFAASMVEGRTVIESAPRSAAANEIRALAEEIGTRL